MDAFARLEELVDEQGYSLRAALLQINTETNEETITFDGIPEDGEGKTIDNASVMVFFMNHHANC